MMWGFGNYCYNPDILCDNVKCIIILDTERSIVSNNPGCKQVFKMLCTIRKATIYKSISNPHCHNFIAWKLVIPLQIIWLLISHHVSNMEDIDSFVGCFVINSIWTSLKLRDTDISIFWISKALIEYVMKNIAFVCIDYQKLFFGSVVHS